MASINKKPTGWQAKVYYKDETGRKRHKTKGGFRTKREAEIYANELTKKSYDGDLSLNTDVPFPQYFLKWFETYKETSVTTRTKATYIQLYNALKQSTLAAIPIGQMDRLKYQQFINEFGPTHAKSTVTKFNSLIHACVKDSIYDGFVKKDFVHGITLVFNAENTRKIDYLNVFETRILLNYVSTTLNPHFTSKYMIVLAINTGMRLGEIQGLMWKNINFDFKTITVDHSWNYEEERIQPTKADSDRIIYVNEATIDILSSLKEHSTNDMVFMNQYKTIPSSSAVNKTLRESLETCGIEKNGFHFHSLRHTHVAYLLSEGIDLYIISKRLGHSDISMTSKVYSYLIDEYRQKSTKQIISSLDNLIDVNTPIPIQSKI